MKIIFGTPEANALKIPDLKPCPFCGLVVSLTVASSGGEWCVYCEACLSHGPAAGDERLAIAAWNRYPVTEAQP